MRGEEVDSAVIKKIFLLKNDWYLITTVEEVFKCINILWKRGDLGSDDVLPGKPLRDALKWPFIRALHSGGGIKEQAARIMIHLGMHIPEGHRPRSTVFSIAHDSRPSAKKPPLRISRGNCDF